MLDVSYMPGGICSAMLCWQQVSMPVIKMAAGDTTACSTPNSDKLQFMIGYP